MVMEALENNVMYKLLLVIVTVIFLVWGNNHKNKSREYKNLNSSLLDSLYHYKDKDKNNTSKISVLETRNLNTFLKLDAKDQQIKDLQKLVKDNKKKLKNGGSVTTIESITNIKETFPVKVDTSVSNSSIYISEIDMNKWIKGTVLARKDSIKVDLKVFNKYSVLIGEEKVGNGLFKKRVPYSIITNYNPYSFNEKQRTYRVSLPKQKKNHIVFFGGINQRLEPTLGIGYARSIVSF